MKLLYPYTLPILLFFSCTNTSKNNTCKEIEEILISQREIINLNYELIQKSYLINQKSRKFENLNNEAIKIKEAFNNLYNHNNAIPNKNIISERLNYIYYNLDNNLEPLDKDYFKKIQLINHQLKLLNKENKCSNIWNNKVSVIEEQTSNILFSILKNDKFLYNKTEVLPLNSECFSTKNYKDSCELIIGVFAFDSSETHTINYWIDDPLKIDSNKIELKTHPGERFFIKASKGKHKVYGDFTYKRNNQSYTKQWEHELYIK